MRSAALATFYGPLAPPPRDLFGFVVWEVLSARALPSRRDIAWLALKRLPALTPDAMFRAPRGDLQAALAMLPGRDERLDELRAASGHLRRHRDLDQVVAGRCRGPCGRWLRCPRSTPGRPRACAAVPGRPRRGACRRRHRSASSPVCTGWGTRGRARCTGSARRRRRLPIAAADLDLLRQAAIAARPPRHACLRRRAPRTAASARWPRTACRHAAAGPTDQLNDATRRRSDFT